MSLITKRAIDEKLKEEREKIHQKQTINLELFKNMINDLWGDRTYSDFSKNPNFLKILVKEFNELTDSMTRAHVITETLVMIQEFDSLTQKQVGELITKQLKDLAEND